MRKPNLDIEIAILKSGLKKWQIAEKLGLQDCNFSRKLRKELPKEEKERIFQIIKELKSGYREV